MHWPCIKAKPNGGLEITNEGLSLDLETFNGTLVDPGYALTKTSTGIWFQ